MDRVHAHIGSQLYKTEIKSAIHSIIADEPEERGGKDLGFSPEELLCAALAACTCATLRMYAHRKDWHLTDVKVEITFERDAQENKTHMVREIELTGDLDEEQRHRLLTVAYSCPMHKTLSHPIEIESRLK